MLLLFSSPIYSQIDSDTEYNSAAYNGDINKIRQLIQDGMKINDPTNILTTAIGRGYPDVFWVLAEYIDLKKVNNLDIVLYQACSCAYKGYTKIVVALLENGADPLAPIYGEIRNFNPIYNLAFGASNDPYAIESKEILDVLLWTLVHSWGDMCFPVVTGSLLQQQ